MRAPKGDRTHRSRNGFYRALWKYVLSSPRAGRGTPCLDRTSIPPVHLDRRRPRPAAAARLSLTSIPPVHLDRRRPKPAAAAYLSLTSIPLVHLDKRRPRPAAAAAAAHTSKQKQHKRASTQHDPKEREADTHTHALSKMCNYGRQYLLHSCLQGRNPLLEPKVATDMRLY